MSDEGMLRRVVGICRSLAEVEELQRPCAAIVHTDYLPPVSLIAWARHQVALVPLGSDDHVVVDGVTLGELRRWVS